MASAGGICPKYHLMSQATASSPPATQITPSCMAGIDEGVELISKPSTRDELARKLRKMLGRQPAQAHEQVISEWRRPETPAADGCSL